MAVLGHVPLFFLIFWDRCEIEVGLMHSGLPGVLSYSLLLVIVSPGTTTFIPPLGCPLIVTENRSLPRTMAYLFWF
jgi:hypothetical protein